jgi:hypothetical protein
LDNGGIIASYRYFGEVLMGVYFGQLGVFDTLNQWHSWQGVIDAKSLVMFLLDARPLKWV